MKRRSEDLQQVVGEKTLHHPLHNNEVNDEAMAGLLGKSDRPAAMYMQSLQFAGLHQRVTQAGVGLQQQDTRRVPRNGFDASDLEHLYLKHRGLPPVIVNAAHSPKA
ncbi:MAG TPA: hypothetical protein VGP72_24705 [Planctomycetota bacterium]|jgi:hypothetical protein